ncbi:MAG: hypothetical protein A3F11_08705 [Gammaproteobacteria bacterium RIFCSPHIGHO2_12_FULL_37_14]|nr:MAG: hypothetical protein A3F11_08705 [Gammaproteobacteria bacterium RIFCSPHIGHO2_12_FULL_37_14]
MSNLQEILTQALGENQLIIHPDQQQKLVHYLELLQTWNNVFNLTAITSPRDQVYLHLIDSLLVQTHLQGTYCLDVGSGAGLPGIPLAIIQPKHQWILLDKNSKKTRFMTQVIAELKLPQITVIHSNCEAFHPQHQFDSIVSRAFGSLHHFVQMTKHLLTSDGRLLAMKGKFPQKEIDDMPNGFMVENVIRLHLQGITVERHIVCIRRVNN